MRDQRFVAAHRGGPLSKADHILLLIWAADCAERVLPLFQVVSYDDRPAKAIRVARDWASGKVATGVAMKASVAAHAAAREVDGNGATAVARAAGHAVATAHFADHCLGASLYALKAISAKGDDSPVELDWQIAQIPVELRSIVVDGLRLRLSAMKIDAKIS